MAKKINLDFSYSVPISESAMVDSDFVIAGTAINATTTSNNHKFISEELRSSAETLKGVPLLVDHENKVENIKGRVFLSAYNETANKIDFKAKVMDKTCKEMIKDGRLNSVSVGASVKEVEECEDGTLIPRGIQFKELSLVAVPADSQATFSIALKEAYGVKEEDDEESDETEFEDKDALDKGAAQEKKEHSWLTDEQARHVASDHLKEDPKYYDNEMAHDLLNKFPDNFKKKNNDTDDTDNDDNDTKGEDKNKQEPKDEEDKEDKKKKKKDTKDSAEELITSKLELNIKEEVKQMSDTITETVIEKSSDALKLEAMEKAMKAMTEKLEALTPKTIVKNESDDTEANVTEDYKIVREHNAFTYLANKY